MATNTSHEAYPEEEENFEDIRWNDADISTIPFTEQRAFGRQLWRRPIQFVPASTQVPAATTSAKIDGQSFAARYLAIVRPDGPLPSKTEAYPNCGVCGAPVTEASNRDHYLSPAHQLALPEYHTPSGIDRTRIGLKFLEKHGFDVDARIGLGASGQGMLFPIVPKEKRDKLGLGSDKKLLERHKKIESTHQRGTLDAGKMRKLAAVHKKRDEKLREMFYGDDRVERYLGGGENIDHGLK